MSIEETAAALREQVERGDGATALALAAGSWRVWLESGELEEGRALLAAALAADGAGAPSADRALVLYGDGLLAFRQGDQEAARTRNEEALAVARAAGDERSESIALVGLARVAFRDGDYARVRHLASEARAIAQGLDDPAAEAGPLHLLAAGTRLGGDFVAARALYSENLALNERLGKMRSVAMEHHNLGWIELHLGDAQAAAAHFAQIPESADAYGRAWLDVNAAALAHARGEQEEAARLLAAGEAALEEAGIVADPDDAFELDWLRRQLSRTATRD